MERSNTQFFSSAKRLLLSASVIILALSIFLQPLAIAQSRSTSNHSWSTSKRKKTKDSRLAVPVSVQSGGRTNNKKGLTTDCSSQTTLRQEITRRLRFLAQPPPPFLTGISVPLIHKKPRKTYEDLYWSARTLQDISLRLLQSARHAVDL